MDGTPSASGNILLDSLERSTFEELWPHLTPRDFMLREVLIARDERPRHVFFIRKGLVSLVSLMSDGSSVEMGTVGREGVVCVPAMLGRTGMLNAHAVAQIPGSALALDVEVFLEWLKTTAGFRDVIDRYTHCLFIMVSQNAACNRLHSMEQRASKWLLMTHDRADDNRFVITHEFLAQMLGSRRATVTEVAQELQDRGGIEYHRGHVTILDRARLEASTCECYGIVRTTFDGLLD